MWSSMVVIQCRLHNALLPVPTITDHTDSVPSFGWCLGCWISRHFSGWPCPCLGWLQVNFRVRKGRRLNQTLASNPFLSRILHFHLSIWVICPWKKLEASVGPFFLAPWGSFFSASWGSFFFGYVVPGLEPGRNMHKGLSYCLPCLETAHQGWAHF